jgi:hypothetical protein
MILIFLDKLQDGQGGQLFLSNQIFSKASQTSRTQTKKEDSDTSLLCCLQAALSFFFFLNSQIHRAKIF